MLTRDYKLESLLMVIYFPTQLGRNCVWPRRNFEIYSSSNNSYSIQPFSQQLHPSCYRRTWAGKWHGPSLLSNLFVSYMTRLMLDSMIMRFVTSWQIFLQSLRRFGILFGLVTFLWFISISLTWWSVGKFVASIYKTLMLPHPGLRGGLCVGSCRHICDENDLTMFWEWFCSSFTKQSLLRIGTRGGHSRWKGFHKFLSSIAFYWKKNIQIRGINLSACELWSDQPTWKLSEKRLAQCSI